MILNFLKLIRVHHWVKNLLIFIPFIAAHIQIDLIQFYKMIIAFFSFSLSASGVYVFNDIIDIENDRKHSSKRKRLLASGVFQKKIAYIIIPLFYISSLSLAFFVNINFALIIFTYIVLNKIYSLFLKKFFLIDCIILANFYTLRIFSGSEALSIKLSFWLISFSIFIFLSLALLKRYVELNERKKYVNFSTYGRGYKISDKSNLSKLGIISGFLSCLILIFYIQDNKVFELYKEPTIIWLFIPCIFFWINYIWIRARQGQVNDDPIIFAIKDKISILIGFICLIIYFLATFGVKV